MNISNERIALIQADIRGNIERFDKNIASQLPSHIEEVRQRFRDIDSLLTELLQLRGASAPAQIQVSPCCGMYETCTAPCTPRGEYLERNRNVAASQSLYKQNASHRLKQQATSVPDGWKLVPIKATSEMLSTWAKKWPEPVFTDRNAECPCLGFATVDAIYNAMLAAAPEAPKS